MFKKSINQKQELTVAAMFVNGSELNEHSLSRTLQGCFLPSFGSQLHLAKRLQRRDLLKIDQSDTKIACGGHVCKRIGTK